MVHTLHRDLTEQFHRDTINALVTFVGVALWAFLCKLGLFFIAPSTNHGSAVGHTEHGFEAGEMTHKTGQVVGCLIILIDKRFCYVTLDFFGDGQAFVALSVVLAFLMLSRVHL